MSDRLIGIRAKIERAKEHVRNLESTMQAFRGSDPYGFRIDDDPETGDKIHRIQIRSQTPCSFSLIAGDAIHNIRSALDHLACRLVEANGRQPHGSTYFPIAETFEKYKASKGGKVEGMSAVAKDLIDATKPYGESGGTDDLWALHRLDIHDKHKLLMVTAFSISAVRMSWRTGGTPAYLGVLTKIDGVPPFEVTLNVPTVNGVINQKLSINVPIGASPEGKLSFFEDGTEIGRMLSPVNPDAYFQLTSEIAFREPEIVKGKPVIPFINQLAHLVDSIVSQFVPLL